VSPSARHLGAEVQTVAEDAFVALVAERGKHVVVEVQELVAEVELGVDEAAEALVGDVRARLVAPPHDTLDGRLLVEELLAHGQGGGHQQPSGLHRDAAVLGLDLAGSRSRRRQMGLGAVRKEPER
jgi:hypothetical protein